MHKADSWHNVWQFFFRLFSHCWFFGRLVRVVDSGEVSLLLVGTHPQTSVEKAGIQLTKDGEREIFCCRGVVFGGGRGSRIKASCVSPTAGGPLRTQISSAGPRQNGGVSRGVPGLRPAVSGGNAGYGPRAH